MKKNTWSSNHGLSHQVWINLCMLSFSLLCLIGGVTTAGVHLHSNFFLVEPGNGHQLSHSAVPSTVFRSNQNFPY